MDKRKELACLLVDNRRYLCSQLATLTIGGQPQCVNIEEIWGTGVVLECESPVADGAPASLAVESVIFEGHVADVRKDEFGWRVGMEFSAATPWLPENWKPEHLLDPAALRQD